AQLEFLSPSRRRTALQRARAARILKPMFFYFILEDSCRIKKDLDPLSRLWTTPEPQGKP
nr:hypothetical protein [Tanacetum cinerariifolium]